MTELRPSKITRDMKTVSVFIERAKDGVYSACMPDDNKLHFGAIGKGAASKKYDGDGIHVQFR